MFESIAAWMIVALFVLGVWLMASATWGSAARASEIQIPLVEQGQGVMPGRSCLPKTRTPPFSRGGSAVATR